MQKIKFCKVEDLPEGKSVDKKILARKIAVFNDKGKITAMESECKHMKAPLNMAEAVDGVVTCNQLGEFRIWIFHDGGWIFRGGGQVSLPGGVIVT